MSWDTVIGLEIHVQLNTNSKLFSAASTTYGATANTQASFIDLGLPGVLPTLNQEAVNMAIKLGLSIGSDINKKSEFARKNYFYPDLPKGYQISQDDQPILKNGAIDISMADSRFTTVEITRAHLEEDAGQSTHDTIPGFSGINLNRAGVPLIEIVTEPVISSADEAVALVKSIRTLVRYLEISTGNMQEGAMRCDVNVSMRKSNKDPLGKRVEVKNINSFKFIEKAIKYETSRQIKLIENGESVAQETRLYNPKTNTTKTMRSKEDALDYRYFPDPDLTIITITDDDINKIKQTLPELPINRSNRFIKDYAIKSSEAKILCLDLKLANYFEQLINKTTCSAQNVANWLCGEYLSLLKKNQLEHSQEPISIDNFAILLNRIEDKTISNSAAKTVLAKLFTKDQSVDTIISNENLTQITNHSELETMVANVLLNNPGQLQDYKNGRDKLFGFFVGQVMKESKGKANPQLVSDLVKKALSA